MNLPTDKCIQILSIGDHIVEGRYRLHSRFNRVINLVNESNQLLSIVKSNIGPGPINIVVDGLDFSSCSSLVINSSVIHIDDLEIKLDNSLKYDSTMKYHHIDELTFKSNLETFSEFLYALAPSESLISLSSSRFDFSMQSKFQNQLLEQMKEGIDLIFNEDIIRGIKLIGGLGWGLTPSGDDWIAGFLIGLNILQVICQKDYYNLRVSVYEHARGTNVLTNTFLLHARDGFLTLKIKNLVTTLLYQHEGAIYEATKELLTIGATSGADLGVGLLMTLKRRNQI